MTETRNIVILGASFAGLSAGHYFLKHLLPALKTAHKDATYHVYLVNPSPTFYWRVAGPRVLVADNLLPRSKYMYDIKDGFKTYPTNQWTLVLGSAVSLDDKARTVTIKKNVGGEEKLSYHSLILSTGTHTLTPSMSPWPDTAATEKELESLHRRIPQAKSIIIGGGGPAGVETAGEIAAYINGEPGFFGSKPPHKKADITLISGDKKLLPILRPALARQAEKYLARVGVDVKYSIRVESTSQAADGKTTVLLNNGDTVTCDIYIPATGTIPNTEFLPSHLKTEKGYVKTNGTTLRVDAAGPRVYCLGDVGSYTRGGVMDIYDAVPVAMTNMKTDLLAYNSCAPVIEVEKPGNEGQVQKGDRPYKPNLTETQLVPIGGKGVGAVFGWKLPSIMIYLIKGRDYLVSNAAPIVDGSKWAKESKWKGDA